MNKERIDIVERIYQNADAKNAVAVVIHIRDLDSLIVAARENDRLKQQVMLWERQSLAPMPAGGDQAELLEFVEWVRQTSGRAASRHLGGDPDAATAALAEMGQRAADLLNQGQMQEEVSSEDRYDLATLPAPSDVFEEE